MQQFMQMYEVKQNMLLAADFITNERKKLLEGRY